MKRNEPSRVLKEQEGSCLIERTNFELCCYNEVKSIFMENKEG